MTQILTVTLMALKTIARLAIEPVPGEMHLWEQKARAHRLVGM